MPSLSLSRWSLTLKNLGETRENGLKNLGGIGDLGIKNLGGIGKDFC